MDSHRVGSRKPGILAGRVGSRFSWAGSGRILKFGPACNSVVDSHLGGYSEVVVDEDSVQQSAEGREGSFDTVLNFAVQTA